MKLLDVTPLENWQEIDPLGWRTIVGEILEVFNSSVGPRYGAMLSAHRRGDLPAVAEGAHALKSSFGNVGLVEAARILAEIEKQATDFKADAVKQSLGDLELIYEASLKELRKFAA